LSFVVAAAGCSTDNAPVEGTELQQASGALTGSIQDDFEDGSLQGWIPRGGSVVLSNVTDQANTGTHSLLTTGRTAGFNGPSLNVTSQLVKGATYQVKVSARLVAGTPATTMNMTMQRTPTSGSTAFDSIAFGVAATDSAWVTLSGTYTFSTDVTNLLLYVESASATASYYIDTFSLTQLTPPPLSADFEDGGLDGWVPRGGSVVLTNVTDQANTGTHSLLTTGRTAGFNGPSIHLASQLTKGATYQVKVSARLVTGTTATTVSLTMQRTPTTGSTAFDSIASGVAITDSAWVNLSGIYSFSSDVTDLLLYVESASTTASYYIDTFSITQLAPPPGPPGNTAGASSTFESQTAEGWKSRTGGETVAVTNADAHGGSFSLLTTNRTATYQGPAFDVTNVMFNGSTYHVELWAKLAPGATSTQLRVSLDRKLGTALETFTTLVPNTTVTADAWVLMSATFTVNLANTSLVLYVESASGTPSFYIDDFKITFLQPAVAERNIPSVYQTVAAQFPIGAAVRTADLSGEAAFLLTKHYNSITSENDMKWDATEPTEGTFTFTTADSEVAFAKANNMHVRGHTLVWHNQIPAWVFNDASGNPMTPTPDNRALLIQRMQNHITAVMTHFGADVGTWDVVNEPIDPSQPDGLRRSPWYNIIGPDYIDIAFQAARAAAPGAKLYLNEFSTTDPTKLAFLASVVSGLKSRGVPIDGVGHQMHSNVDFPQAADVVNAVNTIAALGVENSITELDVSVYSNSFSTPVTDYTDIPQDRFLKQGYRYHAFFQAFKQLQGKIASVTFWGKADDHTWLTSSTKVDGPLLFDTQLQHKYAYWAVVDPLQLPGADVSTSISVAPGAVPAGQAIAYTITVTNNADTNQQPFDPTDDDLPASNVVLSTAVPAHTVFQSLTPAAGWTCTTPAAGASGLVKCTLGSLPVGGIATFTLTVALSDCATQDASAIVATANVTSTTADPNPAPNNTASAAVQVSNAPPAITAVGPLATTVECATSYVDPGATAVDACQGPVAVTTSGSVNVGQVGSYALTYSAVDQAGGQAAPVVRTVTVADTTPPVVTVLGPNPEIVECATTFVDPGATALDSCVGPLPVAASGAVDAGVPGSYSLGYAAIDPSGNTGMASRLVMVNDTTPPVMNVVDLTILAKNLTIVVNDGTLTIGGLHLPLNLSGQVSVEGHTITFEGTSVTIDGLPMLSGGRTIVLLPPNHDYHTFTIADLISGVTDSCDMQLGIGDAVITQVSSDEAANVPGSGNTQNDIVIAPDCRSAQVRIERQGGGNGRVYTFALHVQDLAGNRTATTVEVMVPPNAGTLTAVDDGPAYTVPSACP
jgi:endo-1,4-beta-xylanase